MDVNVIDSAVLDVSGRGYRGATSWTGYAPTSALGASGNGGGSHAGLGSDSGAVSSGKAFDDYTWPSLGGGGGAGSSSGGHGGGVIVIAAGRDAIIDKALANGTTINSGGAGGTVRISATGMLTLGLAEAKGAAGVNSSYGGGGGGIIALFTGSFGGALANPTFNAAIDAALDVRGGMSGTSAAGAGLVYLRSNTFESGVLLVDNEGQATRKDSTVIRGLRGAIAATSTSTITASSASLFSNWSPIGFAVTVDTGEGGDSLGDNTLFEVTGRSNAVLTLDGDPTVVTAAAGASGEWAFVHILDHLEIIDNANVDATDALIRVKDGSWLFGDDTKFGIGGGLADTKLDSGQTPGLLLDLDTVTELTVAGSAARFDVPKSVQGQTLEPYWSKVTLTGTVELDHLLVASMASADISAALTDVTSIETLGDLTVNASSVELTGLGNGLVAGASNTLRLSGGASVTHQVPTTTENRRIRLFGGNIIADAGTGIDADGKGHTYSQPPPVVAAAPSGNSGGTHCGRGFNETTGLYYDDVFEPIWGGVGPAWSGYRGGGAIRIIAQNSADLDGTITADGALGGAGGAIWVSADTIDLGGTATATGGVQASGSGGGGCIAFRAQTSVSGALASTAVGASIAAHGGSYNSVHAGGAGLIYIQSSSSDDGDLIAWNANYAGTQDDSTSLPALPVGTISGATGNTLTVTGATLTGQRANSKNRVRLVDASETASLDDETLRTVTSATSNQLLLDADATAFSGKSYASYYRFDKLEVSGNAHFKTNAHLRIDEGSVTQSALDEVSVTGGISAPYIDFGPNYRLVLSGSNVRFDVAKDVHSSTMNPAWTATLNGNIRLPELRTQSLTATSLNLKEVNSLHAVGSIAFTSATCTTCVAISASENIHWSSGTFDIRALQAGLDMTLTNTNILLHGHNTSLPAGMTDGLVAGQDLTMGGSSFYLTHPAVAAAFGLAPVRRVNVAAGRDLSLASVANINVTGKGWPGGSASNSTAGWGLNVNLRPGNYAGGSHLGVGRSTTSAQPTYDLYMSPYLPGTGGGAFYRYVGGSNPYQWYDGGAGGGVVRAAAGRNAQLDGNISALGTTISTGGSGGAIHVTAGGNLSAQGTLDVRGGSSTTDGGPGGGGAIALIGATLSGDIVGATPTTKLKAAGGAGVTNGEAGGAGTVFLRATGTEAYGHLIVDNYGQNVFADSTRLPFSGASTWAAVSYDATSDRTTFMRTVNAAFDSYFSPTGYSVNPSVLQGGPTLLDDQVAPLVAVATHDATVAGNWTALAAIGTAYIPHYRFDTLTVTGNGQLFSDAEVYVRAGHWQRVGTNFSVNGTIDVTRLDLNDVTSLTIAGIRAGLEVDDLIAGNSHDPAFSLNLQNSLTLAGPIRVPGNLTLSNINIAGTGEFTVPGDVSLTDVGFVGASLSAASLTLVNTGGSTETFNVGAVDVAQAVSIDNYNTYATSLEAQSVTAVDAYVDVDALTVGGDIVSLHGSDFLTGTMDVTGHGYFSGAGSSIRYADASFGGNVTFADGATFQADGDETQELVAGGTFRLTGNSTGTHVQHPSTNGARRMLSISAQKIIVDASSYIDVDGKGYGGSTAGIAPSASLAAAQYAGGSHVGLGYPTSVSDKKTYDNIYDPAWAGASGGQSPYGYYNTCYNNYGGYYYQCGAAQTAYRTLTYGGGVVRLTAGEEIVIDGQIEARGLNGSSTTGAAGGAVSIRAPYVSLNGRILAGGGNGSYFNFYSPNSSSIQSVYTYYAGGGGAVAIVADAVGGKIATANPWEAVDLAGGTNNGGSVAGTGTFYLEVDGTRSLIVHNPGPAADGYTQLPLGGGSTIESVNAANKTFVSSSAASFAIVSPVGYFLNPGADTLTSTLSDDPILKVTSVDVGSRTLGFATDLAGVAIANRYWRPFYEFDFVHLSNARLRIEGQFLVRMGSYFPTGTASTSTFGSPGGLAYSGNFSVTEASEVMRPDLRAFVTNRSDIPGAGLEIFAETALSDTFSSALEAADELCQSEALAANLTGTFKAWLGTSAVAPRDRLPYNGKWHLIGSDTYFASGRSDLFDGTLSGPINRTAAGALVSDALTVWTGTSSAGVSGATCGDWTTTGTGGSGTAGDTAASWTQTGNIDCVSTGRLYCFEVLGTEVVPRVVSASQLFQNSGTFTVPAGVTQIRVVAVGGGGGGGGSGANGGGGGGAGGRVAAGLFAVSPGASLTVTVGGGGARGVAGAVGSAGGDSGVTGYLTAVGGGGGGSGATAGGGVGGTGGSGGGGGGSGSANAYGGRGGVGGGAGQAGSAAGGAGGTWGSFLGLVSGANWNVGGGGYATSARSNLNNGGGGGGGLGLTDIMPGASGGSTGGNLSGAGGRGGYGFGAGGGGGGGDSAQGGSGYPGAVYIEY
jgi:hypothetical protein